MKFCKNCGNELSPGAKFCKHCGQPVNTPEEQPQQSFSNESDSVSTGAVNKKPSEPPKQKKMSKKMKVIISSAAALVIILAASYIVGGKLLSPKKTVEKFETAMDDDDAEAVADMISSNDNDLKIDTDSVQGFIDYYNDHSSEKDDLIDHLTKQGDDDGESGDEHAVNLVKDGKTFVVYDDYAIEVSPVYFEVYTNFADTEISMDDEVIATSDADDYTKELGPFLPGKYTFTADYKSELAELSTEVESEQLDPESTGDVELYIEGNEVEVYAPYEDVLDSVNMYIDGEDTGVDVSGDDIIGPVELDGSMTASFEAEFPWGPLMTEEMPIDSEYMEVFFQADDDLRSTIQDTIVQYNQEYLDVYTSADESNFNVAGEEVIEDIVEQAENEKDNESFYQYKLKGIDFYEDSFTLDNHENEWYLSVDTIVTMDENLDYDPDEDDEDDDSNFEEIEEDFGYELQYDEDDEEWVVTYVGWAGDMDEDMMSEYEEEDPDIYTTEWAEEDKDDDDDD